MKVRMYIILNAIGLIIAIVGLVASFVVVFNLPNGKTQQDIPAPSMYADITHNLSAVLIGNNKEQYIKAMYIQFKDTTACVKFSVPERFENKFITNLLTVSLKYNVTDTESRGDELGVQVVKWSTEIFGTIDFKENETSHISPPLRNY